jgi:nanoRNase/pAp phosphatase (c-di-AMP/oligoRNAs hydrolase)
MMRRARTRKKLERIRAIAREAEKVLVLLWGNPDPDCMASAVALGTLIHPSARRFEIAYTGELSRPENIAMARVLEIRMSKFAPDMIDDRTAVFTVDAQPAFFDLDPAPRFDAVIDHHPRKARNEAAVVDIRSSYGATATILTEYFQAFRRKIPRRIATALLYGLKTDTNNLTRNVSEADIRAFQTLRPLADPNAIRSIELEQLPADVLDVLAQAIAKRRAIDDWLVAYMGELSTPDYGVYVADLFIRTWGVAAAAVALRHRDKLIVILRSDGLKHEVGRIVERVFRGYGTAGGHRTMARAELDLDRITAETGNPRDWAVEAWLLQKLTGNFPSAPRTQRA